jgi:hypothetical protein
MNKGTLVMDGPLLLHVHRSGHREAGARLKSFMTQTCGQAKSQVSEVNYVHSITTSLRIRLAHYPGQLEVYPTLRYQYAVLAYAASSLSEVAFAVVCTPLLPNLQSGAIFVREGWMTNVTETHREYLEEMLREWIIRIKDLDDSIFAQVNELSTGPLRTLETGECDQANLLVVPRSYLGPSFLRLA